MNWTFAEWVLSRLSKSNAQYVQRHPIGKAALWSIRIGASLMLVDAVLFWKAYCVYLRGGTDVL